MKNVNNGEVGKSSNRDYVIDILRVIGTLLVILAHVNPPRMISEIRTFDVTLLVFISGMSLAYSKYNSYCSYLKKRISKLCVPTYITICIVLALLLIGSAISKSFSISLQYVLSSFLLIDNNSIGFVWIVKVYLFIALLTPVIKAIVNRIPNTAIIFALANVWMIVATFGAVYLPQNIIIQEYLLYAIQYAAVAIMGLSYAKSSKNQRIAAFIICAFAFGIVQMLVGTFSPSEYKYPPQFYYLSYGIFVSIGLHILLTTVKQNSDSKSCEIIEWLSSNSFTIYICHIYLMWGYFLIGRIVPNVTKKISWLPLYIIVVIGACALCKLLELLQAKIRRNRGR